MHNSKAVQGSTNACIFAYAFVYVSKNFQIVANFRF